MASGEIKYRLGLDVGNVPAASAQASKALEGIGKSGQSSAAQTVAATGQVSKAVEGVARSSTVSAAQTAAAMRTLPAQFTDIATQLQGGASPLTVLLQQGGQIKDSFGGIGPAFKALTGLITPTGLALTAAAATLGGFAYALQRAQSDAVALDNALRLTNNSAGLTQSSFETLTQSVARAADVSKGTAREAAQAVAGSGLFNPTTATEAAKAIALFSKATGRDAADALAVFEGFTKDASGAAAKLNERVHFLTSDTYAHIVALQQQGKNSEAAALALSLFNARMEETPPKLTAIGRLLEYGSKKFSEFFEAAKGSDTPEAKIAGLQQAIKANLALIERAKGANEGAGALAVDNGGAIAGAKARIAQFEAEITALQKSKKATEEAADAKQKADQKALQSQGAQDYVKRLREQSDAQYRLNSAVAEYKRQVEALAGTPQAISQADQDKQLKWIREQNADRQGMAAYEAQLSLRLASERAASTLRLGIVENEEARLAVARAAGLASFDDIEAQRVSIQRRRLAEKAELLKQELAIESQRRPTDDAGRINQQAKLADIRAQQGAVQGEIARVALESQARINDRALQEAQASAREYSQLYLQAAELSQQLAAQTATGMAQMITDPLDRARAEAEVSVQALLRNTERMRVALQNQIDILRGTAAQAIEAGDASKAAELRSRADVLQGQLGGIQAGTQGAARGIRMKAEASVVDDYLKSTDIGNNIAQGFDRASQSLATYVQSFSKLVDEQRNYESMLRADGLTDEKRMQLNRQHAMAQIDGYGNMAAAAKGFFQEGSRGYRTLETAERTFRAIELASAVQAAATKLGLLGAVTTAKLATDATQAASDTARSGVEQGNSLSTAAVKGVEAVVNAIRTLPFPLNLAAGAATAAAIAALGVSITGGGFGGSSGGFASTNEGTGTVLGDGGAKSESVSKSIEALKDVDTLTMRYSAGMLASLKSIESNIGGLAALLVQSGGLSASAAGVQTGFQRDALGNSISAFYGMTTKAIEAIPGLGRYLSGINGAIGSAVSNLFGTKTSIEGQGIFAGAQSLTQILANGFQAQYYTDIERKRKFLGVTTSTSRSTQYTDADPLLERQLGTVFSNFAKSVESAAAPLGVSLAEVDRRINSFVVDIGRIDLNSLSGSQIQERLTAVLSAAGDRLASSALGGFEAFQKVGEGYLQTITRTAIGVETAQQALDRLNVTAVSLANVMNKQGDVAVELIRDSILAKEGLSGIADILGTLDGSASDLASTYESLTDVRTSLQLLGLNGSAVGRALINGADGLQSLTDSIAAYENGFLTQSQQVDIQAQRIALQFANLGLVMPSTSEQFVAMVKGIDTSSDAGQKLLGSVLSLSGGFADLMSAIKDVGSGIAGEIERIKGLSATSAAQSYGSLQASFAVRTAQARAGDQTAIDELPKISQGLLDAARASASSALDYTLAQSRTLASLQETLAVISDPSSRLTNVPVFASATTLMGGGQEEVIAQLRALRAEMEAIKSGQLDGFAAVATHTSNTASILNRLSPGGDAIVTTPLV